MNETSGIVVRVEGEHAWVRAESAGKACGACAQRDSCGSFSLGNPMDGQKNLLRLPNTIHARPGDAVMICAAEGMVLRAVWRAYGIPLLLGLFGAIAGQAWFGNEIAAIVGMLGGLVGGFVLMRSRGLDSDRAEPILSLGFKRLP
jgi:sigma-E factor negative regulatory protein RseC